MRWCHWINSRSKIGSDNDYGEPYYVAAQGDFKQREPNRVLEAVRSSLRLEFCSVEDVVGVGGLSAPFRVVAMDTLDEVNAAGYAGGTTKRYLKSAFSWTYCHHRFRDW